MGVCCGGGGDGSGIWGDIEKLLRIKTDDVIQTFAFLCAAERAGPLVFVVYFVYSCMYLNAASMYRLRILPHRFIIGNTGSTTTFFLQDPK